MPVVRLPAPLQRYADGQAQLTVTGATAREALESACGSYPDLRIRLFDAAGEVFPYLLLFKDDIAATLTTDLAETDTLEVIAAVEGG